jgi:hypothetical protein
MVPCPSCGHTNLPGYQTCSKCGSALSGGGGPSEYEQLMAKRAAAARRNRMIYGTAALGVAAVVGAFMVRDRKEKAALQDKLDFFERWAALEKKETGAFWNCVMASEVDVGMFQNANQIQQRIESAYATQQKTFADYLVTDCVPKIERARQAMASLQDAPADFKGALATYAATLPKLQSGLESYSENVKKRGTTKDLDQVIHEVGGAWHAETAPSPTTLAYDKFLVCAIPGIDGMKDAQAVLEFLAEQCYKKDPVAFMDRVRKDCGPIIQDPDPKAKATPAYKARLKKLYEQEARQMQAWDSCSRRSRKGKKVDDLEAFLVATGEYMKNRNDVAKVAKDLATGGK